MNKKNNELIDLPLWFDPKGYITEETQEHTKISMLYVMNYPDANQNKKAKL